MRDLNFDKNYSSLTSRGEHPGSRLGQSINMRDLLTQSSKLISTPAKIGLAKVADLYPSNLNDRIDAHPQPPFATFIKEASQSKNYFRTGDKQSVISTNNLS